MKKFSSSLLFLPFAILPVLAQSSGVNVVVDMQGIDPAKYNSDLQSCQGTAAQVQPTQGQRESLAGTAARGAALGAAAGAISGNSGTQGAKSGAGAGVVAAGVRNSQNRRSATQQSQSEVDAVVKNCMRGRGYNVLN
ncbi:MAG: glycine zipper family protein [bacterium]